MSPGQAPRHVALALIFDPNTRKLLMITSRTHPHLWILPKGGIEKGETSGQAAVRESCEEAGTPPSLPPPTDEDRLMVLNLEPASSHKRAAVWHIHALPVTAPEVEACHDWLERGQRKREWVTPSECLTRSQAWYSDSKAAPELDEETVVVEEGKKESKQAKQAKQAAKKKVRGGAFEEALRAFVKLKGWDLSEE